MLGAAYLLTRRVFALYFHWWQAVTFLLTMCVFVLHFHFWLADILNVRCPLTACVFALNFHFWHALIIIFRISFNRLCLCSLFSFLTSFRILIISHNLAMTFALAGRIGVNTNDCPGCQFSNLITFDSSGVGSKESSFMVTATAKLKHPQKGKWS